MLFLATGMLSAAQPAGAGQRYETDFGTILRITADLHRSLKGPSKTELHAKPILLDRLATPYLQAHPTAISNSTQAVNLSSGCVDLLNYVSHAKAIDETSKGFLDESIARLSQANGTNRLPDLRTSLVRDAWSFEIMNRQASHFNQMAGALIAIQMAHVSLGHYQKYTRQRVLAPNQSLPINSVITPAEWRNAVLRGADLALECGLEIEGLNIFFKSIDKMPARPSWTVYFVPDGVELARITRELDRLHRRNVFSSTSQALPREAWKLHHEGEQAVVPRETSSRQ